MDELGLAEAIGQLRREIGVAMESARGEALQFQLGPVELELQVRVSSKAGIKGEAKWFVVSFGADAGTEHAGTHTVKLKLTPRVPGGGDILVSDETQLPG